MRLNGAKSVFKTPKCSSSRSRSQPLEGALAPGCKPPDMSKWSLSDIPDQSAITAVVTGSNSGIGYEAAKVLAQRGATVVLACRNLSKAREAAARIGGKTEVVELDLASLRSVRRGAEELLERFPQLHLLVNNAGVMVPPYSLTEDGYEMQMGTNHLGHFALTGLLIGRLQATPQSRIVTVSSVAHYFGKIRFDDLQSQSGYRAARAYAQSKLANLLFTYELQRRLRAAGASTLSVAAHPGWSRTQLQRHTQGNVLIHWLNSLVEKIFSQDQRMGAMPGLRAALDPSVGEADFYGPSGFLQLKGEPVRVTSNSASHNQEVQRKLWEVSQQLTGVRFLS